MHTNTGTARKETLELRRKTLDALLRTGLKHGSFQTADKRVFVCVEASHSRLYLHLAFGDGHDKNIANLVDAVKLIAEAHRGYPFCAFCAEKLHDCAECGSEYCDSEIDGNPECGRKPVGGDGMTYCSQRCADKNTQR